jgi:hypothetical protein
MAKQLVVMSGLERGRVIPLAETDLVQMGCSQHLAVEHRFRDPSVARVHCEIQVQDGRALLIDAGTTQGTFLNGKPITQEELKPSDIIRIGNTQIRFLDEKATQAVLCSPRPEVGAASRAAPVRLGSPDPPWERGEGVSGTDILPQLVGRQIGRFKIELVLGTGRWGRAFRAHDQRKNRAVALKVLRPEFAEDPERLHHFAQALKAVAPLRHPNLVTHYGAGKALPFCWIAMELVDGNSLTSTIRRIGTAGLLDWRYVGRVAVQLAGALAVAHEQRVIHGQITPQNILLRERDLGPQLGDLLLANTLTRGKTASGQLPSERSDATPYLPPEQMAGSAALDERSDIYGLGAVIYALLTGRPPFLGQSCEETLSEIHQLEPVSPTKYQPSLPPRFESMVLKMLSKQPENRFQSAAELLASLEQVQSCSRTTA